MKDLTPRKLAIVLASLRMAEMQIARSQSNGTLDKWMPEHFFDIPGEVTADEIADLCEELNCS
jgi:hypothetical protein